jgi:hypothetical protein
MAGIVFFFEENDIDIFSGRDLDLSAWNYAIKAAGDVNKVIVINRTSQQLTSFDSDLLLFEVVSEIPVLTGTVVHVVTPWDPAVTKTSLWSFDHNVDWYIFGPGNGWHISDNIENGVYVPMSGRGALHSVHIASVVMLHRYEVI